MTDAYPTDRWRGILVLTLGAGGIGLLGKRPSLLLVAALGVVVAAYPFVSSPPRPRLRLERRVSEENPDHGDRVEVTTTVWNAGERPLFDLRLVDGTPSALSVVEGSPRHGTALLPGRSASFSYVVEARRGQHRFDPATAVVRNLSGAHEVETEVAAETTIECPSGVPRAPLRSRAVGGAGRIASEQGGSGTEFYQTRAYRPGDPVNRIDWNRYAQTGDLTTVEYRVERAATVVIVIDARPAAYRGRADEPHAVDYGVAAARELLESALDERNRVGIAGLGRDAPWIAPGTGRAHRVRARRLLATHAAFGSRPPDDGPSLSDRAATIRSRLPTDAQPLVFTPLLDNEIVEFVRRFEAEGRPPSVISPDVTEPGSVGRTLAAVERTERVRELRRIGVPVVDWSPDRPLAAAVADAAEVSKP
ncbi:DUF58 domain-containing protein [Halobellus sp. GM3]|uniref:DUF58 domain-containing protein n=1 Tax=Halobellus sp. GM3 TaxID=3458410 RepID=UPI00403DEC9E